MLSATILRAVQLLCEAANTLLPGVGPHTPASLSALLRTGELAGALVVEAMPTVVDAAHQGPTAKLMRVMDLLDEAHEVLFGQRAASAEDLVRFVAPGGAATTAASAFDFYQLRRSA